MTSPYSFSAATTLTTYGAACVLAGAPSAGSATARLTTVATRAARRTAGLQVSNVVPPSSCSRCHGWVRRLHANDSRTKAILTNLYGCVAILLLLMGRGLVPSPTVRLGAVKRARAPPWT